MRHHLLTTTIELSKTSTQRSIGILEALLELEAEEQANNRQRHNASATPSLTQKFVNTLKRFQQNNKIASEEVMSMTNRNTGQLPDTPVSIPTVEYGLNDLDVLPILSSDSGFDFWQFLDSYPLSLSSAEDEFFKGAA